MLNYVVWASLFSIPPLVLLAAAVPSFLAETKSGGDTSSFLFRHLFRIGMGLGVAGLMSVVDYRLLARWSRPALIGAIGEFKGGGSSLKLGGGPVVLTGSEVKIETALLVKLGASLKMGAG